MDATKFNDLYRIESTRLKGWDYSTPGWYFLTICVLGKRWSFGSVENDEMKLSRIGRIVYRCWEEIPKHFDNVKLKSFVVMPNHVHGVIDILNVNWKPAYTIDSNIVNNSQVETHHDASLQKLTTRDQNFYSFIAKKSTQYIPLIIKQYKSAVSKICHERNFYFSWQPRFYDVIIRDEYQLYFIEEYIKNNPINWKKDPNYE
jgi:putative transposase